MKPVRPVISAQLTPVTAPSPSPAITYAATQLELLNWANQTVPRADFDDMRIEDADLTSARLRDGGWTDVVVTGGQLAATDLTGTAFRRVELSRIRADGLVASSTTARDVSVSDAKLLLANFRFAKWNRVLFSNCNLSEADFAGSTLTSVYFQGCDLTGANFSGATLKDVDLTSSVFLDISGIEGLRGATISSSQIISLAPVFATALGIIIKDR